MKSLDAISSAAMCSAGMTLICSGQYNGPCGSGKGLLSVLPVLQAGMFLRCGGW
jgi:hypothetical protein